MPFQGKKLPPARTAALIALWIDLGAPYGHPNSDGDASIADSPTRMDSPAAEEQRSPLQGSDHWAYHPPQETAPSKGQEPGLGQQSDRLLSGRQAREARS